MHDCTDTTDDDDQLARDLQEAFKPLLSAIEKPDLRLHSITTENGVIAAMIELAGTDRTWLLTLPTDAPGSASLTLVSG